MLELSSRIVLLDIEGTTSSVSYVFDVLYPYARKKLPEFLKSNWSAPKVIAAIEQLEKDLEALEIEPWKQDSKFEAKIEEVVVQANKLMDKDVKATGLKELQGLIWAEGYDAKELKSHVYPDVLPNLKKWKDTGLDIRIFSSGSINAQKVFFKNTEYGDILNNFSMHYDTTSGPKREYTSYQNIVSDCNVKAAEITFLSDIVEELDAAQEAELNTVLVKRPGNHPLTKDSNHKEVNSFEELSINLKAN